MKSEIQQRLQILAKEFPLAKRDEIDRKLCDDFPFNIKNQDDEFYDGMLFMLRIISDVYYSIDDMRRISMLTLVICYAWQEKYEVFTDEEIDV